MKTYSNSKGEYLFVEVPEDAIGFEIKDKESMPVALMVQISVASFYPIIIPDGNYTILGASDDEKFPYEEIVEQYYEDFAFKNYAYIAEQGKDYAFDDWGMASAKDSFFSLLSSLGITKRTIVIQKNKT